MKNYNIYLFTVTALSIHSLGLKDISLFSGLCFQFIINTIYSYQHFKSLTFFLVLFSLTQAQCHLCFYFSLSPIIKHQTVGRRKPTIMLNNLYCSTLQYTFCQSIQAKAIIINIQKFPVFVVIVEYIQVNITCIKHFFIHSSLTTDSSYQHWNKS